VITPPQSMSVPRIGMYVANQFGSSRLDTKRLVPTSTGTAALLCIPSTLPAP
jgi:hypothetical protein